MRFEMPTKNVPRGDRKNFIVFYNKGMNYITITDNFKFIPITNLYWQHLRVTLVNTIWNFCVLFERSNDTHRFWFHRTRWSLSQRAHESMWRTTHSSQRELLAWRNGKPESVAPPSITYLNIFPITKYNIFTNLFTCNMGTSFSQVTKYFSHHQYTM